MVRFSYSKPSAVACTGFGGEPNEEKAELPGNEASLNFVSLRSLCNFVGRLGPSRAPILTLDGPPRPRGMCVRFSISCVLFFRQSRCLHRWAPEPTSPIPSKGIQADQEVDAGDAVGQLGPCVNGLFQFRPPRTPKLSSS